MRYAILSDIHANLDALEAVLTETTRADVQHYLCCGDLVGYGAEPAACLQRLRTLPLTVVAGNHDWACVGKVEASWFNRYARAAVEWTRDQLSFTDLAYLRALHAKDTHGPVTLVHGTLRCPEKFEYLMDLAQALETATIAKTPWCCVGHTHRPLLVEVDRHRSTVVRALTDGQTLLHVTVDPARYAYVLNPGSVGQPRDGDPRASVAILDTDEYWVDVRRVPYDVEAAQRKIRAAGLPAFAADRLAVGQ